MLTNTFICSDIQYTLSFMAPIYFFYPNINKHLTIAKRNYLEEREIQIEYKSHINSYLTEKTRKLKALSLLNIYQ